MSVQPDPLSDPSSTSLLEGTGAPVEPVLARRRRFGPVAGALIILSLIALVVGPLLYVGLPREIARWRIAAALEKRLAGDVAAAIRELDGAIAQFSENDELYRQRAEWRLEIHQYDLALLDANRAVELAPVSVQDYLVRSVVFQRLKQHAQAIADWNTIVRLSERGAGVSLTEALNGRAYARAVGKRELREASADIGAAIQASGANGAMLDTRGFIRFLQGDLQTARSDLDHAVTLIEDEHKKALNDLADNRRLGVPDPRQFELDLKRHAESVAVIRYHRSLVYDKLGMRDRAEEDRQRVRELGFQPDENLF